MTRAVTPKRNPFVWLTCALWGCAAVGCLADVEPEVGDLRAGACKPDDSDPSHNVSFASDVLPLFQRPFGQAGCGCHQPGNKKTSGIDATGLNLFSYATLIRGGNTSHDTIVVPGNPCKSLIVQKVSEAPPVGARMPSDGPPYLTPVEIGLLSDWIAEGAHDN
jgi:hypothetical protein